MKRFLLILVSILMLGTFIISNVYADDKVYIVNILILGEGGSGKTVLRSALINEAEPTEDGLRERTKKTNCVSYQKLKNDTVFVSDSINLNEKKYKFLFWDTCGDEKNQKALIKHSDKIGTAFIIVMDLERAYYQLFDSRMAEKEGYRFYNGNYTTFVADFKNKYNNVIYHNDKSKKVPKILYVATKEDLVRGKPNYPDFIYNIFNKLAPPSDVFIVSALEYTKSLKSILVNMGVCEDAQKRQSALSDELNLVTRKRSETKNENSVLKYSDMKKRNEREIQLSGEKKANAIDLIDKSKKLINDENNGINKLKEELQTLVKDDVIHTIGDPVAQDKFEKYVNGADTLSFFEKLFEKLDCTIM